MRRRGLLLAVCLMPALTACGAGPEASGVSVETKTPARILEEQLQDDTHDAFLVDTGGRLGTLLVTAELEEFDEALRESLVHFAIWNPTDMSHPIQEMEKTVFNAFGWHEELDANFDGFEDFSYTYAMGNQPSYGYLWIWNEDAAQFVEVPEYAHISSPRCDPETGIIDGWARSSGAGDGVTTFHRWEGGELICIRRIESCCRWGEGEVSTVFVEERVDGELQQVYYEKFLWDGEEIEGRELWRQVSWKWKDLDYHGET